MAYTMLNIDEVEPGGRTGVVKFVRRELGLEAFGLNWFDLPPNDEGRAMLTSWPIALSCAMTLSAMTGSTITRVPDS